MRDCYLICDHAQGGSADSVGRRTRRTKYAKCSVKLGGSAHAELQLKTDNPNCEGRIDTAEASISKTKFGESNSAF